MFQEKTVYHQGRSYRAFEENGELYVIQTYLTGIFEIPERTISRWSKEGRIPRRKHPIRPTGFYVKMSHIDQVRNDDNPFDGLEKITRAQRNR